MNGNIKTCECGCGTIIAANRRFVSGHNRRGQKNSHHWIVACKKRMIENNPAKRPEVRAKIKSSNTGKKHSISVKQKMSKSHKTRIEKFGVNPNSVGNAFGKRTGSALDNIIAGFKKRKYSYGKYGWFVSLKLNKKIFYRSSFELKLLEILENMDNIINIKSENIHIPYVFEGKSHVYISDFLVEFYGNIECIIEVKPKFKLADKKTKAKIASGFEYSLKNNIPYIIFTEKELFNSNSVTTMLNQVIDSATASAQNERRDSLTSLVTARTEEKSLSRLEEEVYA